MNAQVLYPKFVGLPGYYVFVLAAGGTWPTDAINSYQDQACTVPNSNPVLLDTNGEAVIFVKQAYKLIYAETSPTSPTWTSPDLNVPTDPVVLGTVTAGTTDNLYVVTSSPAQTVLTDQMTLVITPDADSASTTSSTTFTGTGQNDCTFSGTYTGTTSGSVFTVQVASTGTPDVVKWKKDGGSWTTVNITGGVQTMIEGLSFKFARTTGHTVSDLWAITVQLPVKINLDGLGAKIAYENIAGTMTAVGSGMKAGFPCQFIYSTSQGAWVWVNPAAPSLTTPAPNRVRKEVAVDYTVILDDAGNEVAMTASGKTFTLPAAADFANQFVYLQGVGVSVTVTADGTEKIYLPYDATGSSSVTIGTGSYDTVQFQSDSIGWHVLTTAGASTPHGRTQLANSATWICPGGVTTIYASATGGGGGGSSNGAGGSAGKRILMRNCTVVPGTTYTATVGTGGTGGTGGAAGSAGGLTKLVTGVTTIFSLSGGAAGSGGSPGPGEDSLYGYGGSLGSGAIGGNAEGYGAGGGGSDNASNAGGNGANGYIILEW